jgi:hypothetical protein
MKSQCQVEEKSQPPRLPLAENWHLQACGQVWATRFLRGRHNKVQDNGMSTVDWWGLCRC